MGISIGKVRAVLLGSGILLLLAITAFLLYAHLRAGLFVRGLPARLGIDIKQETNGFTYSQSSAGRGTIFTIHAAKAIQHSNGKLTLHDVGIILYGREPHGAGSADRADRIYGDEFEYDQNTGEASATGDVRIDLQAPAAAFKGKQEGGIHVVLPPSDQAGQPDARIVHVRTHGLVFQQKLGLASSSGQIDFASGGMSGHAIGAEYNTQTGIVILQSAVHVSGLLGKADKERLAVLTAAHATLDRAGNKAVFTEARYVSPGQGLAADHAVVHTAHDGTPQAVEAAGHVVLSGNGQGTVSSGRMDAILNAAGKPQSSHLYDTVRYDDEAGGRGSQGTAADARVTFDDQGRASHVLLTGGVSGEQRGSAATRTLSAATLDLSLAPAGLGHSILRDAKASGNARLRQVAAPSGPKKPGATTDDLAGDTLLAHFVPAGTQARLATVDGQGHTVLHQTAEDGAEETSLGDTLSATFRPAGHTSSPAFQPAGSMKPQRSESAHLAKSSSPAPARPSSAKSPEAQVELQTAIQRGNVTSVRKLPAKPDAAPEIQHSSADEATYDADTGRIDLHGKAQFTDAASTLYAEHVTVERASGDAQANGNVRVTYIQASAPSASPPEPVHVLASRATMHHDAGVALFYGTPGTPARMWQGPSRVDAPVLEFVEDGKRLTARGDTDRSNAPAVVHAILLSAPGAVPKSSAKPSSIIRIAAAEMIYSDQARQVDLNGKVRVDDPDGIMTANHATVYLAAAGDPIAHTSAAPKPAPPGSLMGGQVDRIVATGAVQVTQPDRHADGERLVYTAADKTFILTGTKAAPPRLFDQTRGTIVGGSLQFRSGDDSVLVSGGDGANGPQRVRTDTHVKQ